MKKHRFLIKNIKFIMLKLYKKLLLIKNRVKINFFIKILNKHNNKNYKEVKV